MKVHIRVPCSFCEGEVYLPDREAVSCTGERNTQHRRFAYCLGSGEQDNWIDLKEFADMLERATSMELDYQELARVNPHRNIRTVEMRLGCNVQSEFQPKP